MLVILRPSKYAYAFRDTIPLKGLQHERAQPPKKESGLGRTELFFYY
jgi:hypothetical protein